MDNRRALEVVSTLADGKHPDTGETFPSDSPYRSVTVLRALCVAILELEVTLRRAGAGATETADQQLIERFNHGSDVNALVRPNDRTPAGALYTTGAIWIDQTPRHDPPPAADSQTIDHNSRSKVNEPLRD